jgi:3-oxoacyl-[acyl-carrier protein] reductase
MSDLKGRTALVTGGSRGLGSACCRLLAEAGANVAVNYRANEEEAVRTAAQVEKAGARAHVVQADVSKPDQVNAMVQNVTAALGPVELLVNSAGIFDIVTHDQITLEIWQRTLDVNLTSVYLVTWAVKDAMIERGYGRIVNLASIAVCVPGRRPFPTRSARRRSFP